MTQVFDTTDWRFAVRHSRMLCLVWSPAARHGATQRAKLAYAMALGKPIRLLVRPGVALPEDLCPGYGDVQVARVASDAAAAEQVQAWLGELDRKEGA